jgi:hypothetical protein
MRIFCKEPGKSGDDLTLNNAKFSHCGYHYKCVCVCVCAHVFDLIYILYFYVTPQKCSDTEINLFWLSEQEILFIKIKLDRM